MAAAARARLPAAWRTLGCRACGGTAAASEGLPPHAWRLEGLPSDQRLTLLPLLQGRLQGPGGGAEAASAVRARAPRQVFVELCPSRYAEALASVVLGLSTGPPPRVDVLGNIHGGLLMHELVPVLQAAREVGAAVIPVDRPRAATRSRMAQRLWHPKFIQGLLRYGSHSLRQRTAADPRAGAEALRKELESCCPAAHEILVSERSAFMAHQVRTAAIPRAEAVVVCSALHCAALASALQRAPAPDAADAFARLARRGVPTWPLFLVVYGLVPAVATYYAASWAWGNLMELSEAPAGEL
uniref:Uncharacterized protein n=1 Tax=Alexandrium catenella TaxID=2925 RepID=A0A7S1RGL9_ALECA|mmetsp:Transcript_56726/g.151938  ORF Transcript_56726/g.151938 Transcript_56726/m.151938 type:complete len:299 (+) Transcript_56726:72-968(+)